MCKGTGWEEYAVWVWKGQVVGRWAVGVRKDTQGYMGWDQQQEGQGGLRRMLVSHGYTRGATWIRVGAQVRDDAQRGEAKKVSGDMIGAMQIGRAHGGSERYHMGWGRCTER